MDVNTQPYQIKHELNKSEQNGHLFENAKQRFNKLSDFLNDEILNQLKGQTLAIYAAALCLVVFAAFLGKNTISGLIDPEASWNPTIFLVFGGGLSIIGMWLGHCIRENSSKNAETGKKSYRFWVILLGAGLYLFTHYSIAELAGAGIPEDSSPLRHVPTVVLLVASMELLLGFFMDLQPLQYFRLLLAKLTMRLCLWMINKRMSRTSRQCTVHYREYRRQVEIFNGENPENQITGEGNPNIRQAISYYTGEPSGEDDSDNGSVGLEYSEPSGFDSGNAQQRRIQQTNGHNDSQNGNGVDLDSFLNDEIDDNLTF